MLNYGEEPTKGLIKAAEHYEIEPRQLGRMIVEGDGEFRPWKDYDYVLEHYYMGDGQGRDELEVVEIVGVRLLDLEYSYASLDEDVGDFEVWRNDVETVLRRFGILASIQIFLEMSR